MNIFFWSFSGNLLTSDTIESKRIQKIKILIYVFIHMLNHWWLYKKFILLIFTIFTPFFLACSRIQVYLGCLSLICKGKRWHYKENSATIFLPNTSLGIDIVVLDLCRIVDDEEQDDDDFDGIEVILWKSKQQCDSYLSKYSNSNNS